MTARSVSDPPSVGFDRRLGGSKSRPAIIMTSSEAGPAPSSRKNEHNAHNEQETRPDSQQSGLDITDILIRLGRIRTEISALPPLDHHLVGDKILHDLDEVIQLAGPAAPCLVNGDELSPPPQSPKASTHDAIRLPSGPDYPAHSYR